MLIADRLESIGYVVVPSVLSPADLEPIEQEYSTLVASRIADWTRDGRLSGADLTVSGARAALGHLASLPKFDTTLLAELDITLPHVPSSAITADSEFHIGPGLLQLVSNPTLTMVISQVIGDWVTLSPNGHARFKLPWRGASGITPWHRDAMTHDVGSDPVQVVTCWIPMDDVTTDNGCLVVVPGGHRTHTTLNWPLTADVIAELDAAAVPLLVQRGDIVLMHKHLPHASLPNDSGAVRWSFDLRYYPTQDPSDRPWFPSLEVRRPEGLPQPRLDAAQWRARWEAVRSSFSEQARLVPGRPEYAQAVAGRNSRVR